MLLRLLLGLTLLLAGCAPAMQQARYDALQNVTYTGNANRDLVPYQARNRDASTCATAVVAPSVMAGLSEDEAFAAFFRCMAEKGWQ